MYRDSPFGRCVHQEAEAEAEAEKLSRALTTIYPYRATSVKRGKRGPVDRASDSEYMNGCPAWVRARLVPQICVNFLCP